MKNRSFPKDVVQILKEESVIIVTMVSSISHTVSHAVVALKEQHRKFVIKKMRDASVKRTLKDSNAIVVLMVHTICKVPIQRDAQNVSVSAKLHAVIVHICVHSMLAC